MNLVPLSLFPPDAPSYFNVLDPPILAKTLKYLPNMLVRSLLLNIIQRNGTTAAIWLSETKQNLSNWTGDSFDSQRKFLSENGREIIHFEIFRDYEINVPSLVSLTPNLTSIDTQNCSLSSDAWEMILSKCNTKNLVSINLTANRLTRFYVQPDLFPNLKSLELMTNQIISEYAKQICLLTGLTTLNLGFNHFCDEGLNNISLLTNLVYINLIRSSVTDKTIKAITGLTKLEGLIIANNPIQPIGATHIAKMTQLKTLWCWGCGLLSLGAQEIGSLTNLTKLNIAENNLLDDGFVHTMNLTNLKKLFSMKNALNNIPSSLSLLTNLIELDLSYNNITSCSNITSLTNLQTLTLEKNEISDISNIEKLVNLTSLNLAFNAINNLDAYRFTVLTNLTYLDLHRNPIDQVNSSLLKKNKLPRCSLRL